MKATNIIWDIDFDDEVNLPNEIRIPEGMIDEDEISDYLSNITGYCHKGFLFDRVKIYRDCGEKDGNIMKLIYHDKEHGNTAIIEEVLFHIVRQHIDKRDIRLHIWLIMITILCIVYPYLRHWRTQKQT